ncbi:PREDICTED: uncharacterized protein C2orf47 homolog, mitochondrial-like [Priapulus caudatus]|uniref:Uncharacterized protein C2orf47 homolog, mitochondrial-like n=1 Tax=Priapulus caudatus TaxID=37621 RepID=A0ABM1F5R8_PRICU|nr:PREDICTED: uncharacterized protein C2orf47 homolog, mitochondrial-like [Priapulus caudatus]
MAAPIVNRNFLQVISKLAVLPKYHARTVSQKQFYCCAANIDWRIRYKIVGNDLSGHCAQNIRNFSRSLSTITTPNNNMAITITNYFVHCRDKSRPNHIQDQRRYYCSPEESDKQHVTKSEHIPMKLMDVDDIVWPNLWKTIKNQIYYKLVQIYFDNKFSITEFTDGTKQAFSYVSNLLSDGKFDELEDEKLVTGEALREVRWNYNKLDLKQKMLLAVPTSDIYFAFPYEVEIIYDEEKGKKFLEIMMVFHCFKGLDTFKKSSEATFNELQQNKSNITIANYRFIREYTKGVNGNWTINVLNHIRPIEHEDEKSSS